MKTLEQIVYHETHAFIDRLFKDPEFNHLDDKAKAELTIRVRDLLDDFRCNLAREVLELSRQ